LRTEVEDQRQTSEFRIADGRIRHGES
jgi:hypothetical protein